jgi:hypothetical protein
MADNYTTPERVASLIKCLPDEVDAEWLNWGDEILEEYLGGGYKGVTKNKEFLGTGTSSLRLPIEIATVNSVSYADGTGTIDSTAYYLGHDSRTLYAKGFSEYGYGYGNGSYYFGFNPMRLQTAEWLTKVLYTVNYTEQAITPKRIVRVATEVVAAITMFSKKYGTHGIAKTSTKSASSGGGSQAVTLSFPDSLSLEIDDLLERAFKYRGLYVV